MVTTGEIMLQVQNAIRLYEQNKIPALQQQLYELYMNFNKPGNGYLITTYPQKEQLAECFTMMHRFDWTQDSDIREVWAENGFYCLIEYITHIYSQDDLIIGGFDLFLHLYYCKESLKYKIDQILFKASLLNEPTFDDIDYTNEAEYLIEQFLFLSAQIIRPIVIKNNKILTDDIKTYYYSLLSREDLYTLSPTKILSKAKFISRIIGSILNDM